MQLGADDLRLLVSKTTSVPLSDCWTSSDF